MGVDNGVVNKKQLKKNAFSELITDDNFFKPIITVKSVTVIIVLILRPRIFKFRCLRL